MQNLDQIRARNALNFATKHGAEVTGPQGGEVIKKLPSLILNHGLLATAAYSFTEKKGWQVTFDALAQHLADKDVAAVARQVSDRSTLMDYLTAPGTTSEVLQHATAEALSWLGYARRFVRKPEKEKAAP